MRWRRKGRIILRRDAGDRSRQRAHKGNRPGSRTFRRQPAENELGSEV